jgi:type IV secretory pathway component VirB8
MFVSEPNGKTKEKNRWDRARVMKKKKEGLAVYVCAALGQTVIIIIIIIAIVF